MTWKLHEGDCLKTMSLMDDGIFDLIVTSPPYNIKTGAGASWNVDDWYEDDMPEEEYQYWQMLCVKEMLRVLKLGGVLCYNHEVRQKNGKAIHPLSWLPKEYLYQEVVWDRKSTHNHCKSYFHPVDERIFIFCKDKPKTFNNMGFQTIWRFSFETNTKHPAPFPEGLADVCIKAFTEKGDKVLDPFSGSGTVLYVSEQLGRNGTGIEISKDYCEIIKKRMSEIQCSLFE